MNFIAARSVFRMHFISDFILGFLVRNIKHNCGSLVCVNEIIRGRKSFYFGLFFSFCPLLTYVSNKLKLDDSLAGATLLAFGNSSPDFFTSFSSYKGDTVMTYAQLYGKSFLSNLYRKLISSNC